MSRRKSYGLGEITARFGGELMGDPAIRVSQVATLEAAGPTDIVFISQARYLRQLRDTKAAAAILAADAPEAARIARIVCANPYAYFAKVSGLLNPAAPTVAGVHTSAVVDKSARVDKTAADRRRRCHRQAGAHRQARANRRRAALSGMIRASATTPCCMRTCRFITRAGLVRAA